MKKFPSIGQFRNVIQEVRRQHDYQGKDENDSAVYTHCSPYPTLTFKGTVKLHGTNGGIVLYADGNIKFQSRGQELSLYKDNMGFMNFLNGRDLSKLFKGIKFKDYIAIYGEWCGKGIQKGVGISELERIFVIFKCQVDGEWVDYNRFDLDNRIFNINHFPRHTVKIDFEKPEAVQNEIMQRTLEVEEECPVAKFFGIDKGIGEGLVYTCVENPNLFFKSKGEKHSSSNVKTLAAVDVEKIGKVEGFVDYACTENRLNQGLEHVELGIKNTGDFVRWIANDIIKEETDTLEGNGLTWKDVAGSVAKKSSEFFRIKSS